MRGILLAVALGAVCGAGQTRADVFPFVMPSRNVLCSVGIEARGADIWCTIFDRSGPVPLPRPAGCRAGWGHVFTMRERGRVEMRCEAPGPGSMAAGVEIARYGQTGTWGGITCLSAESGLECRNRDGHGFRLSRRVQAVW